MAILEAESGGGARLAGMGNASELLINVVNFEVPKQLIGTDQTVCGRMPLFIVGARRQGGHRRIDRP